jgi:hypothetical protein
MKIQATLKFITPCFCAGANRLEAEIRAPSIRGELRWWFRCLGADKSAEDTIFGGIAGNARASGLQVRVSDVTRSDTVYAPTHAKLTDPGSYLHFYLDQPPKDGESRLWITPPDRNLGKKGTPRPESCLPAESSFLLHLHSVRPIPEPHKQGLDLAIEAMLRFGSIGFRHTRGFGAWHWVEEPINVGALEELTKKVKEIAPGFDFWFAPSAANRPDSLLNQIEGKLKSMRKPTAEGPPTLPAKNLTALGYAGERGRQTSAVRFRPVQVQTKKGDTQCLGVYGEWSGQSRWLERQGWPRTISHTPY